MSAEVTDVVDALGALAQETRLAVFRLLVQAGPGGVAAGELAAHLDVPPATLSFHLNQLRAADLVRSQRQSRSIFYKANFERMDALMSFLTRNCCAGLSPRLRSKGCRAANSPPTGEIT
ncbi:MAG: ArsR/SmtB family transcription factor [Gammaproteobacteria bacterium]